MTLIQDDSDANGRLQAEGPDGEKDWLLAAAPEVEMRFTVPGTRPAARRLPSALVSSLVIHLAVAALFLTGPGRHLGSLLLSGIRDRGMASIGDAKAEDAGSGHRHPALRRAISVVLVPPAAAKPKAASIPERDGPRPAPPRKKANERQPQKASPILLAKKSASKVAGQRFDIQKTRDAKAVSESRPAAKPAKPPEAAQRRRPPAQRKKTASALTFRQPFLLPASGGPEAWRGALTASGRGRHASTPKGTADKGSGDAAVSNYPGRVARRLNAALRYPSGAKAARLTGEATVSFAVDDSGKASAISIVASSGFDVLDRAAIAAVKRASPFPPIPPEARRSDWPFTVTLAFGK